MSLFAINKILDYIKEKPFRLEKEIQDMVENNLEAVFGLHLIKSEFALNNFRIDSLAFDYETKSFVIIEYKRDKNFSVIDQGYAYLSLMLNNKADFILEYNENLNEPLSRKDVDWSQSKVIFVSQAFTNYQREAINFKDLPIELWEVKKFENKTVSFEQIQKMGSKESIKTISKKDNAIDTVSKEIKVYSEEEHLSNVSNEIKELYEKFRNAILDFGEIEVKPKKHYVAFIKEKNVVDIIPQRKNLKMWINMKKGELDDSKNLTRDVFAVGHWGNGDYELQVKNDDEFEYILSLIKQSVRKNK
ncbi:MAG: putative transport protein [Francisella sp.]|jgi:predicted transport protein